MRPASLTAEPSPTWDRAVEVERGSMAVSLGSLDDLFEPLDPTPWHERDLDEQAERFLVSWVRDLPSHVPLHLTIHVRNEDVNHGAHPSVDRAVRHHFEGLARMSASRFTALMHEGRASLAIGLAFLFTCILTGNAIAGLLPGEAWARLVREVLSIGGSVAMWRPMQIYPYDWWPIKEDERLYRRMAAMTVELHTASSH
jgi:hypothetical protein